MIYRIIAQSFLFFFILVCSQVSYALVQENHVEIQLIKPTSDSPQIGVYFKIDPEWHIYWKNPGDSGATPKFSINGRPIDKIKWPYPKRIPVGHLVNFGFENETVIFLINKYYSNEDVLNLEWLVCKVDCIPGFADVPLVDESIQLNKDLWTKYQNKVPSEIADGKIEFIRENDSGFEFKLSDTKLLKENLNNLFIFPHDGTRFSTKAPSVSKSDNSINIKAFKSVNVDDKRIPASFTIVLEDNLGNIKSFDIEVEPKQKLSQFFWGLLLALVGGLILNLMPCVFPILFLKAYGFLKTNDPMKVKVSSWLYAFGVVSSFLFLGGLIVVLKQTGQTMGWGFQLQNSYFVGALIVLFLLMSLVFLDVFSFDEVSLPKALQPLLASDFGTGVLAVVVASPCTAPFMGTALGLTLILPPAQSLLIFLALGVGLALPVPVLAHWPGIISKLPRSGSWMLKLKKFMAVPLLATSIWLAWVLYQQLNETQASQIWNSFDAEKIVDVQKNQSVFIDFTAAWCITCQVNKKAVLETPEVVELFQSNKVYLVRADWTNYSEPITKALASYGRNSVPLYVFFNHQTKEEIILPELLTKQSIRSLFLQGAKK